MSIDFIAVAFDQSINQAAKIRHMFGGAAGYRSGRGEGGGASPLIIYNDGAADNRRWQQFSPRAGDIIVSSPPKAGTTLTQMLCALLVFDGPEFPDSLDQISPWFDQITRSDDEALAMLDGQTHRRIIKTHTPLDGIPRFDDTTFISVHRDPRDVLVSWIHHAANIDVEKILSAIDAAGYSERFLEHRQRQPASWDDRFSLWLDLSWEHSVFSFARIARHAVVADERSDDDNVLVLHFADIAGDIENALAAIGDVLGFALSPPRQKDLAAHAAFDSMRSNAANLAPTTKGQLADPASFFRTGAGGDWQTLVSAEVLARYEGGRAPKMQMLHAAA
nr:glycolipid sulfotransferase BCG_1434-like [Nerophis lumbriciformis]